MTFDLLSTIVLTASATVVVATFVALFGSSLTSRISIGAAMALWFIGVLWLGARGNIATPLLGAAVLIPVAVLSVVGFGWTVGRDRLQSAPLPVLIALNVTRLLGVLFVLLYTRALGGQATRHCPQRSSLLEQLRFSRPCDGGNAGGAVCTWP